MTDTDVRQCAEHAVLYHGARDAATAVAITERAVTLTKRDAKRVARYADRVLITLATRAARR